MTGGYPRQRSSWPRELVLDDQPGPAAHITRARSEALIADALLEAGFGEPAPELAPLVGAPAVPERNIETARPPRTRRWGVWGQVAAAIAMCFVGMGSASAAVMLWKKIVQPEPVVTPLPVVEKVRKARRPEPVVVQEAPQPVEAAPVVEEVEKKPRARAPEDWLDDANRLRAKRRWKDADALYARVVQTAPRSSAAYVARVASASVRLEHLRDPRGALARYRAALEQSPRGPLLEEIRFGIAESYRALGRRAEERKALESFVHDLPDSGLAKRARARLEELRARR
jgi:tetratricopeptide (TPR) repeat protein